MRSPTPRQIPIIVVVRVASSASTRQGPSITYINTLRRANLNNKIARVISDSRLVGSIRDGDFLFGPPDPRVQTDDLILVPPILASDPTEPQNGALWINETNGAIKQKSGSEIVTLSDVYRIYSTPVSVVGLALNDLGGGIGQVYVIQGPAKNSAELGIQFRVEAVQRS